MTNLTPASAPTVADAADTLIQPTGPAGRPAGQAGACSCPP